MIGNIEYGTWKDGSTIYKDKKGYYIIQWDNDKGEEYKKYIKNWKPKDKNENSKTKHKTKNKNKHKNKHKNKTKKHTIL